MMSHVYRAANSIGIYDELEPCKMVIVPAIWSTVMADVVTFKLNLDFRRKWLAIFDDLEV